MRRFRFHIGSLVILVLLLGIGFAALRESNDLWDSGIFTVTLGVLLISILLAVHRTEKRGAFWLGFALFGSAYLGLSLVPSIEPRLITTRVLTFLDSKMPRSNPAGAGMAQNDDGSWDLLFVNNSQPNALYLNKGNGTLMVTIGTNENFIRIGHSLLALIAAFVGGQLSRNLHARNRERTLKLSSPETGHEPTEPVS